mmetsp:Transcript_6063/g.14497  ORF Transcript_6063/g.14497 Transcript_6063/m.14497 type:complete len:267 (-) Transcript_6063:91-891(-)
MAEDLLLKKVREFLSTKEPGTVVDALDIAKAIKESKKDVNRCLYSKCQDIVQKEEENGRRWRLKPRECPTSSSQHGGMADHILDTRVAQSRGHVRYGMQEEYLEVHPSGWTCTISLKYKKNDDLEEEETFKGEGPSKAEARKRTKGLALEFAEERGLFCPRNEPFVKTDPPPLVTACLMAAEFLQARAATEHLRDILSPELLNMQEKEREGVVENLGALVRLAETTEKVSPTRLQKLAQLAKSENLAKHKHQLSESALPSWLDELE